MNSNLDNVNRLIKEAKVIGERMTLYKQLKEEILLKQSSNTEEELQKQNTLKLIDESLKMMEDWGISND
jgi:hypothetical protein